MTYEERRVATATADLETAKLLVELARNALDGDERSQPVSAMCKAAMSIVNDAYKAAAKLLHEMTESPFSQEDK